MNKQKTEETVTITESIIEDFLQSLAGSGIKSNTLFGYKTEMRRFTTYLAEYENGVVTRDTRKRYLQWLKNDLQYTPQSISNKMCMFNQFMVYLQHPEWKITGYVSRQNYPYMMPSREEYLTLLRTARDNDMPRAYLLVKVFGGYGIPYRELHKLDVKSAKNKEVVINDQNGEPRTITFPSYFVDELMAFARKRKITDGPIFGTKGEAFRMPMIHRDFARLAELSGIDKKKITASRLVRMYQHTLQSIAENMQKYIDYHYKTMMRTEQNNIGWFFKDTDEETVKKKGE